MYYVKTSLNWKDLRHDVSKTFFSIDENQLLFDKNLNLYFLKIETEKEIRIKDILGVNFSNHNVLIYTPQGSPNLQLIFNDNRFLYPAFGFKEGGLLFEHDAILKIKKTKFGEINPVHIAFQIIDKNDPLKKACDVELLNLDEQNIIRNTPNLDVQEKDLYFTDNICTINKNSDVTLCIIYEGELNLSNYSFNLYNHPSIETFCKKLNTNIISLRQLEPENFTYKCGILGYKPQTNSDEETVSFIKNIIKEKLPTTKKLVFVSWCTGVYHALYLGLKFNATTILIDHIFHYIDKINVIKQWFLKKEYLKIEKKSLLDDDVADIHFFNRFNNKDDLLVKQQVNLSAGKINIHTLNLHNKISEPLFFLLHPNNVLNIHKFL